MEKNILATSPKSAGWIFTNFVRREARPAATKSPRVGACGESSFLQSVASFGGNFGPFSTYFCVPSETFSLKNKGHRPQTVWSPKRPRAFKNQHQNPCQKHEAAEGFAGGLKKVWRARKNETKSVTVPDLGFRCLRAVFVRS